MTLTHWHWKEVVGRARSILSMDVLDAELCNLLYAPIGLLCNIQGFCSSILTDDFYMDPHITKSSFAMFTTSRYNVQALLSS